MVKVVRCHRLAEAVARLEGAADLGEQPSAGSGQPAGRAVQHADRASRAEGAHLLPRSASRQVSEAVVVEVPERQRPAKAVAALDGTPDLREQLAASAAQPAGRADMTVTAPASEKLPMASPGAPMARSAKLSWLKSARTSAAC
jgi:hypothetical protein